MSVRRTVGGFLPRPPLWFRRWKWPAAIVILVIIISGAGIAKLVKQPDESAAVKATWLWSLEGGGEKENRQIVDFARRQGVNLIYLHVESKDLSLKKYRSFVSEARSAGIRVYALGGDPNWSLVSNQKSLTEFVAWVRNYNLVAEQDEKFQGIHVDIEPHILKQWKESQEEIIEQWMINSAYLAHETKTQTGLPLSGDFTFWINSLKVPGKTKTLSSWFLDRFDSITIMAYRNKTEGPDGIHGLVDGLINEAAKHGKKVVVGVNMLPSAEGEKTTFYQESPEQLGKQLELLREKLRDHPGYSGTAVHDYRYWRDSAERPR